jgi:hypothetical protein
MPDVIVTFSAVITCTEPSTEPFSVGACRTKAVPVCAQALQLRISATAHTVGRVAGFFNQPGSIGPIGSRQNSHISENP